MNIRPLKLFDESFGNQWHDEVEGRWLYEDFKANARWRKHWISFDCAAYNPADDRVYLGITSFDADIFKAYDRKSGQFVDLGYSRIADPFDAKFHRALELGDDGCLYAAVALLHDCDRYNEAPGGAIIKYDPRNGDITKVATPLPHVYIQSIALDWGRRMIYCMCFAPEKLAGFNLRTGEVIDYGLFGTGIGGMAQGENLCLDDRGRAWCGWQLTRAWQSAPSADGHRLCCIDPDLGRILFFQNGLPRPDGGYGTVKVEGLFNLGDGHLHASGGNGSIYRINIETGTSQYLFTPITDRRSRLTSLALGPDGCAYGVTGRDGHCQLLRFDFNNNRYDLLGRVGEAGGEGCFQVHHVVFAADGTLYACENDVPHRSAYLWEITDIF
ncbi:MAG: hypothetical protein IT447_01300 [Phycisphaerales bacterium]|jgi:hypothetical protein|nr:hypothetical protein [Phycisphaerales bacterium]